MNRLMTALGAALGLSLVAQLALFGFPAAAPASRQVAPSTNPGNRSNTRNDASNQVDCPLSIEPASAYEDVFEEVLEIPYNFTVTNKGSTTVRIDAVKPSCSCTIVRFDAQTLEPGDSTTFTAVYDVKTQFGKLSTRRIQLVTDHLGCSQLTCEIGGNRRRRFTITPPTVDFGDVIQGESPSRQVTIQAHGSDIKLLPDRIIGTDTRFELDIVRNSRSETGDQLIELNLRVPADALIGTLSGKLFVPREEDDGVGPIVNIHAVISGPLRVTPQVLLFGTMRTQEPRTRTLRLLPTDPTASASISEVSFEAPSNAFAARRSAEREDMLEITFYPDRHSGTDVIQQIGTVTCQFGSEVVRLAIPLTGKLSSNTTGQ